MHSDYGLKKCGLLSGKSKSIDNGLTLVRRLVRAEAMPVLRRSLSLYSEVENQSDARGNFEFTTRYFDAIRTAHFAFLWEMCEIPCAEMPSLEIVRLESQGEWCPGMWYRKGNDYGQCAQDMTVNKYVDSVKQITLQVCCSDGLCKMLDNQSRGFKVEWKDCIYDEVSNIDIVSETDYPNYPGNAC